LTFDSRYSKHVSCNVRYNVLYVQKSDWYIPFVYQKNAECWKMAGMSHVMQDRVVHFGIAGEVLLDVFARETKDVVSKVLFLI